MTAAIGLAGLGKQVAFIEGGDVGGDCTNVGCVPSKNLIHLAKNFKPGMNPDEVMLEVTRKRDALRDKETEEVMHLENVTFVPGWAKFTGPREVKVSMSDGTTRTLTADHIVISTGARPRMLDIPG
ncbi:MAG: NAD(P)/FAD-dependent oxidoreductase, partial [Anaerolineales bacterium]|nr:NAD(P)/FAD-dependent oxidoreductase [Anaerolineales bacterium]